MTLSTVEQYDSGVDVDAEVAALTRRIAADGPRLPLAAAVPDEAAAREAARRAVADLIDKQALDALLAQVKGDGLRLTGPGGFLSELVRAVLERGLRAELTEHLGYARRDASGNGSGNSRNGSTAKTVQTEIGPVDVKVPRDRAGTFTPMLVPKNARRLGGLSDVIISLYAGGMTVRDICHHLQRVYGTEVSPDTVSTITDEVLEEVKAWQHRPLDEVYPIVYVDALMVKVRDGAQVRNKACYLVVGVNTDGVKHVLGIWVQQTEGAKFWMQVCTELRNRGVRDVLIACCDGLTGLPEAIEAVWPHTTVQTCVVHLIRAATKFVSYKDRRVMAAALKDIYTAPTVEAAETAMLGFADSPLGRRYPAAVAVWERAWDRFTPFLAFPPEVRRIIYTTNAIESFNYQIRKIIKNRGHFPTDDAVIKLIWLAIADIEDKRARQRAAEAGRPANSRTAPPRLVEGAGVHGWKQALNALDLFFPNRIPIDAR
ncbi:IS256 family transposase [Solwaraspora sp. WMMA2080]|uniref:IS256 family transposase n=1 Tax=unclassified Solwaraspora TaxID=2627926 RepID=UPI00248AB727|nr:MULTISPECIES: IS256 family transposase [unclassified Solwaraspora]WBB97225.1 IS256 family transposase [Solwaraspora sp. WMMA2059]WBC18874.1 IS256 family transposase [Solwaraspora sp. WMMA2080]